MSDNVMRGVFGACAFVVVGAVVYYVLSPFVPESKEAIANVILGNVLSWPAIVLAFYFGSSSGSKTKTEALAQKMEDTLDLSGSEVEKTT